MTVPKGAARLFTGVVLVGLAAAVGVGAWTVVKRAREPAITTAPIAKAFPFESGDSARLRAFVIVDADDCSGNLSFLELFQRDTSHVRLSRLYLTGPRSGLAATAALLHDKGIDTPLLAETKAVHDALLELGSTDTPFLVVLDADGVVRLGMVSPPDIDTYVKLPQLLKNLWEQGVSDPLKAR
jgi:hypothetical protein